MCRHLGSCRVPSFSSLFTQIFGKDSRHTLISSLHFTSEEWLSHPVPESFLVVCAVTVWVCACLQSSSVQETEAELFQGLPGLLRKGVQGQPVSKTKK